jgi:hypothetical protein
MGQSSVTKTIPLNGSDPITVFNCCEFYRSYYIYVDHNDNIYFSNTKVLLFHENSNNISLVAGTGVKESNDTELNLP